VITTVPLRGRRDHLRRSLAAMRDLVSRGSKDPEVRALAVRIVGSCAERDVACEARAIHRFLRARVRYVRDPLDTEWIQDLGALLASGAGDCDDATVAVLTLGAALGIPGRAVLLTRPPRRWPSHVYAELLDRNAARWLPVDPARPPGVTFLPTDRRATFPMVPGPSTGLGELPPALGIGALAVGLFLLAGGRRPRRFAACTTSARP